MKRRTIAALLACTMVIGTLAGCSSEPKNPGDSDTTVTETTAAETTAVSYRITCNNGNQRTLINP